jgi:Uncharacterized protein conserved in bacteria (DUF2188)
MATNRYVKQNAQGSWDVLKEGHRRSVIQEPSRQAAVSRAQGLVRREGGGEVRVMNDVGKVMDTRTVGASARSAASSAGAARSKSRAVKPR